MGGAGQVRGAEMTPSQERFLRFIEETTRSEGTPPTVREIMAKFGFRSTNAVVDMANRLEAAGLLRSRLRQKSRAFVLTDAGPSAVGHEEKVFWVIDSGMNRGVWIRDRAQALQESRAFAAARVPHRMLRVVTK